MCQAMRAAGITNVESQEGKDFCTECPYPTCVLFGDVKGRVETVLSLHHQEKTLPEIADTLGVSRSTVIRDLRKFRLKPYGRIQKEAKTQEEETK